MRQTYPKEDDKVDTIRKLKGQVRRLEKEKRQLLSELKTLQAAFVETEGYLKKQHWDYSVEEVIAAVKQNRRLQRSKAPEIQCDKCGAEMDQNEVPSIGIIVVCTNCTNRYTLRKK